MALYRTPAGLVAKFADLIEAHDDARERGADYCVTGSVDGMWAVHRLKTIEISDDELRAVVADADSALNAREAAVLVDAGREATCT